MQFCRICFVNLRSASEQGSLCSNCQRELEEFSLRDHRARHVSAQSPICDIHSLWRYRGITRELILRAKVRRDLSALKLLIAITTKRDEAKNLISWSDVVVPAPSSLWSRLYGRLDVASLITTALTEIYGKEIRSAPRELYWRWRKQTRRDRGQRAANDPVESTLVSVRQYFSKFGAFSPDSKSEYPNRVLLVDDVVTTGATLHRTAVALKAHGASVVRCLTLAKS